MTTALSFEPVTLVEVDEMLAHHARRLATSVGDSRTRTTTLVMIDAWLDVRLRLSRSH